MGQNPRLAATGLQRYAAASQEAKVRGAVMNRPHRPAMSLVGMIVVPLHLFSEMMKSVY